MKYSQKVLHGCNRSSKSDYLSDNFLYSKTKDQVYCIYWALFLKEEKRKSLKSQENKRIRNTYHSDAVQEALGIKNKIEKFLHTSPVQNDSVISER